MASKKPVIAANGSCLEEAAGDGAIYVDPLNILEITNTINKVLDNQNLKDDLIKNGIEHFKKFDSELLCKKMLSLYEKTKNA